MGKWRETFSDPEAYLIGEAHEIGVQVAELVETAWRAGAELMRERAAKAAEGNCTCAPYWASYGKTDPQCGAHDAAVVIRALSVEKE